MTVWMYSYCRRIEILSFKPQNRIKSGISRRFSSGIKVLAGLYRSACNSSIMREFDFIQYSIWLHSPTLTVQSMNECHLNQNDIKPRISWYVGQAQVCPAILFFNIRCSRKSPLSSASNLNEAWAILPDDMNIKGGLKEGQGLLRSRI